MIQEITTDSCPHCGRSALVRNGHTAHSKQKYHCRSCGAYGTLNPTVRYSPERKAEILRAYQERASLRGVARIFGVSRPTLAKWLREAAAALPDKLGLAAAASDDVLALGKESGQTAPVERWHNTLRQRLGRFVRQTLSFSKSDEFHLIVLKLFIHSYDNSLSVAS